MQPSTTSLFACFSLKPRPNSMFQKLSPPLISSLSKLTYLGSLVTAHGSPESINQGSY